MATTSTFPTQPLHGGTSHVTAVPPTSKAAAASTPTILQEVDAAQKHLRERLAHATCTPPASTPPSQLPTVPLIDLGASFDGTLTSRQRAARQIRAACTSVGFFQVAQHGISARATAGVLAQARRFFHALPAAHKDALHIRHSPLFRGFEPGDYTSADAGDVRQAGEARAAGDADADAGVGVGVGVGAQEETKQGFNFGYEPALDPTGGDGAYVELDGCPPRDGHGNVWPAEDVLPGFRAGVAEYYAQALALSRHLFRLFALSLELREDYFDGLTTHPGGIGRLLYYPEQPPAVAEGAASEGRLGLGAHTDYECFTLLLADENPGLEILFPPGPLTDDRPLWRPCPVRPGTLTVNVADFLMRWTNGLYKSTVHRVMSRPGTPARYSVPFFFSINYDAEVEALPERIVGKSLFRPMKAGEYILERLKATKTLGEGVDDVGVMA